MKTRTATKHSPPLRARADHIDCRIQEIVDKNEKEAIARDILNGLPEWFGMSDSTEEYIKDSQDKPFIACFIGDEAVGFVVLHTSSKDCAEIFVMGIKKKYHRLGIGRTLHNTYEAMAQKLGYTYSQVKTVQQGHYQAYDITNHFIDPWDTKSWNAFFYNTCE